MLTSRSHPGPLHLSDPIGTLGQLLKTVCSHPDLTPHLLKQRSSHSSRYRNRSILSPQVSFTPYSSSGIVSNYYQLHYGPSYTSSQLMRLIVEIFQGVPEGFTVFHCRPTTTAEELNLFIERMSYHSLSYLVLQVNHLPFKLQEVGTHTHTHTHTHTRSQTCTNTHTCNYAYALWV